MLGVKKAIDKSIEKKAFQSFICIRSLPIGKKQVRKNVEILTKTLKKKKMKD